MRQPLFPLYSSFLPLACFLRPSVEGSEWEQGSRYEFRFSRHLKRAAHVYWRGFKSLICTLLPTFFTVTAFVEEDLKHGYPSVLKIDIANILDISKFIKDGGNVWERICFLTGDLQTIL